jgi:hypothetical protein
MTLAELEAVIEEHSIPIPEGKGCLLWLRGYQQRGYPGIRNGKTMTTVPRLLYQLLHGPLRSDEVTRHTCDHPFCVNREHIISGSQADNMRDRQVRNRAGKKLTPEAVAEIFRLRAEGKSHQAIGAIVGTSKAMAGYVLRGQSWTHVTGAR